MIQIGFPSFLAYQASLGRLGPQVLVTFSSPSPSLLSFTLAQTFGSSSVPSANPAPAAAAAPQGINLTVNLPVGGQMPRVTVIQASDLNIYTIPPVWKRVTAETIDFLILIVLKVSKNITLFIWVKLITLSQVMITFIAVDFFELVDLEQYDLPLDILSLHPDKVFTSTSEARIRVNQMYPQLDVRLALQFTQEILVLELVHR